LVNICLRGDLGIEFCDEGRGICLDLIDARRATNKNLSTIDDGGLHVCVDRFSHDGANTLGFGQVGLNGLPMCGADLSGNSHG
jgi:hypothetical protein